MKKAFTLVEILIVVAILGILAAIVVPQFQSHSQQAKEAAAKDNLRILRNLIELYAARHNDVPPGYINNDPSQSVGYRALADQLIVIGNYLPAYPENPFNGRNSIRLIQNNEAFPTEAQLFDSWGWVYKAATKEIRLNWPGTDSSGVSYFDY